MLDFREMRDAQCWGAFDEQGRMVLTIEARPGECLVRRPSPEGLGRGQLVTAFLGQSAFDSARRFAENCLRDEGPDEPCIRRGHSCFDKTSSRRGESFYSPF